MNNHTQYNLALEYNPIEQKNEVASSNEPGRETIGLAGPALLYWFALALGNV